jgi:lipoyl(octanoyl) transferase
VDVVAHVRRLEDLLIRVTRSFSVEGVRVDGRSGVWVDRGGSLDKVAAIGVRVQRGVTMHGFALNCDNSLEPFSSIIPCGIADAGVTTLSAILGRDLAPVDLLASVRDAFVDEFGAEVAA